MFRTIAAVIVGYIAIALAVFIAMVAGYQLLGEEWAFQPGVYSVSVGWSLLMLGSGLVAAIIGGVVCSVISGRSKRAVRALMVVLVVLGALDAVVRMTTTAPTDAELARTESTPVFEAAGKAQPPRWVTLGNPVVGVIGVCIGGSLLGTRQSGGRPAKNS